MKQETLEEVALLAYPIHLIWDEDERYDCSQELREAFIEGAKWQKEQYTVEEQHVGHTIDELDKEYIKGFNEGSACQQERMYSEEEVIELLQKALTHKDDGETGSLVTAQGQIRTANFYSWFERFKNK